MSPTHAPLRVSMTLVLIAALSLLAGCPVQPGASKRMPPEIQAVQAARDAVTVAPDDPLHNVAPGTFIDDLAGLAGCWAGHQRIVSEEQTPMVDVGDPLLDIYHFFRFDPAAGTVTYQSCAAVLVVPFSLDSCASYHGTYDIVPESGLVIDVESFSTTDPFTGETRTYPDDIDELIDGDQAERDEAREAFEEASTWTFSVTRDGDRILLDPVVLANRAWGTTLVPPSEPSILVRIDCP